MGKVLSEINSEIYCSEIEGNSQS